MDIHEDTVRQNEIAPPGGSIATSLNALEPTPLDRFLWLLPLVALMLFAGALAIYFLPTNLDLLWPLCFWLSLATALLVVVAWRMVPIITSSSNNVVRHGRNSKLITWSPFSSLNTLLLVSILVAALATGGMLSFALDKPSSYSLSRQVEQPFVLLITSAVVIVLLLFVWLVPIRLEYVDTQIQPLINGYAGAHEAYADWFAHIKLGPRDVYSLTEKEAIAFAQRNDINVAGFWPSLGTSLLFSDSWSSRFGVPAIWEMHYISENATKSLDLDVDAATGSVLARNSLPPESTATPTPQPRATASPAP